MDVIGIMMHVAQNRTDIWRALGYMVNIVVVISMALIVINMDIADNMVSTMETVTQCIVLRQPAEPCFLRYYCRRHYQHDHRYFHHHQHTASSLQRSVDNHLQKLGWN